MGALQAILLAEAAVLIVLVLASAALPGRRS
jgi:hypothetical protein